MKRPLWITGCVFLLAVLLLMQTDISLTLVCGGIVLLLIPLLVFSPLRHYAPAFGVCLALLLACVTAGFYHVAYRLPARQADGKTLSLTVVAEESLDGGSALYLRVKEGDLPKNSRLLFYRPSDEDTPGLIIGDEAAGSFTLHEITTFRSENVLLRAEIETLSELHTVSLPWYTVFSSLRQKAGAVLSRYLDTDSAALLRAICFSDKSELSDAICRDFRRAGVSHLLVTSGLHATILAQGILWLMKRVFRCPPRLAALLSCFPILFFMGLCGLGRSILRAGLMQIFLLLAQTGKREADSLNSLGGAMLLLIFFQPYAVFDVGLWLSFGSTAGLLLFLPPIQRTITAKVRFRPLHVLLSAVGVTVAAVLPILPIMAFFFGELSMIAPLTNLLTVSTIAPLLAFVYPALLLALLPGTGFLIQGLLFLAGLLAKYLLFVTRTLASLPFAVLPVDQTYRLFWLIAAVITVVLFGRFLGKRGIVKAAFLCALSLFCGTVIYALSMNGVISLSVVQTEDSTALLLKSGSRCTAILCADTPLKTSRLTERLKRVGVEHVQVLIPPAGVTTGKERVTRFLPSSDCQLSEAADTGIRTAGTVFCRTEGARLSPWSDLTIEAGPNGWLLIRQRDASILIAPSDGDALDIPAEQRQADLVIFDRAVPRHVTALSAQKGLVCCTEKYIPYLTKALPWGSYDLSFSTEKDTVLIRDKQTILW